MNRHESEWVRVDREVSATPYQLRVTDSGALVHVREELLAARDEATETIVLPLTIAEVEWLHEAFGELLALRAEERKNEAANDAA